MMRAEYKFYEMIIMPVIAPSKIPNRGQTKNGIQNVKIMKKAKRSKIINKKRYRLNLLNY